MSFLALREVARSFPGRRGAAPIPALAPVDLDIGRGEFVAVIGPSGCGKSTLLRLVAGLDQPSAGEVLLDGTRITRPGADRGMVFQSYTLFPWLNVEHNIRFGLEEARVPAAMQARIAGALIERVGLRGFERHWPRQLSGGMQQRAALARALAPDPAMLLLDEPFGALDHQTRELMQELLAEIWLAEGTETRKTVLFVTHDIDEAVFLATRVVVMSARPGRILLDLELPLPYPRPYTVKTTPAFTTLKSRLTEAIRGEVRRAALSTP
jgi:ABC-type nitrate/sulfonate/bicarbonate transport system ATPase subunit